MDRTQAAVLGLRLGHATTEDVWKAACEDIVERLGVSRASIWAFADGRERLVCLNLFDGTEKRHGSGLVLDRADHPDYFRAITNNARVVAADALTHPATRGFAGGYFKDSGVRSLLDYIVLHETAPVGVVCCEQAGVAREWSAGDTAYLQAVSMLIGTVFLTARGIPLR